MHSWSRDVVRMGWALGTIVMCAFGWAHPDVPIADTTIRLEPGGAHSFPMAVHYHRVVGEVRVDGAAAEGVEVLVVEEPVWSEHGAWVHVDQAAFAAGVSEATTLSHLLRCCDAGYTDYRLIVRNRGASARDLDVRVWAVHDDFAVVVDRAETGAFGVPFTIFGVLSGLALTVSMRRRKHPWSETQGVQRRTSVALGGSIALASAAVALAVGLGASGALRYGTDPVTGMMSILADVPVPGGPFGSRAALVMGVLLLAWCGAIGAWVRAAAVDRRGPVRPVGFALGAVSLTGGAAMGIAYGSLAVPGVLGVVLGVPLIVAAWRVGPRPSHAQEHGPVG